MIELIVLFAITTIPLTLGLLVGRALEQAHLRSLDEREEALRAHIAVISVKEPLGIAPDSPTPALVTGEAVIGSDHFKIWISALRCIFGGEMRQYSRIFMRARREALLRAMELARQQEFHAICNVRYDACDINNNTDKGKKQIPMAACAVSATAYCTRPRQ